MAYWLVKRAYEHTEARTYINPDTGQPDAVDTIGVALLAYVCDLLPASEHNPEAEGIEIEIRRKVLMKALGIKSKETFRRHLLAVTDADLLNAYRQYENSPYSFSLGANLKCLANGCTKRHHFWQKEGVGKRTRGEGFDHSEGYAETTPRGVPGRPHVRTKELNNSNKGQEVSKPEVSASDVPPGAEPQKAAQPIKPEPDAETLDKLERCRTSIRKALAERVNPLVNPNLFEWTSLMLTNGVDVLDRAIEYTAQGKDLDPAGTKWRGKSAVIDSELIKIGGNE
jgi:hypothetical protein